TDEAASWNSKCSAEETSLNDAKKGVKSIIAGQEERVNWIELHRFIAEALPQPDASNLSEQPKALYYTSNERAQKAAEAFYARMTGKSKGGDEEESLGDLINVNIEAIACRYSSDLSGYNNKLKSIRAQMETMREKDQKTPPEGKGWVVELRGYTYHKDGRRFIV